MVEEEDNSRVFNIEINKSPKVFDPVSAETESLSKDELLTELRRIDDHDAELASGAEENFFVGSKPQPEADQPLASVKKSGGEDLHDIPLEIEKDEFFKKANYYEPYPNSDLPDLARFAPEYLRDNKEISRDILLKESEEPELPIEVEEHYQKSISSTELSSVTAESSSVTAFRQIRGFAFVSGIVVFLLLGAFFVQRGFLAKDRGMERSIAAYDSFRAAEQKLKEFNFLGAEEDFSNAYESLMSAEEAINQIGGLTVSIAENIPFDSRAGSSVSLLRAAKHIAKAGKIASSAFALSPLNKALSAKSFTGMLAGEIGESSYTQDTFYVFQEKISMAETELELAKREMENVDYLDFPEDIRGDIAELNEKVPALLGIIKGIRDYSEISAFLFGMDKPRRYLVIFQNSSELRPTGGFIGSYAIIEVDNGGIKDIFVDGIYSADGQLTVNIVPPEPFQHITTAWSTHDANWFLDFPSSAEKIAWFYERTGGGKVDGVISLNVEVIEWLLEITGPISISQYDLTLDANNFRDEIQYEVEVAYDKKLNRPKQVLADFAPLFFDKLFEVSKIKSNEIISVLLRSLEEKYIMFYLADARAQKFFEKQGWSGEVKCQVANIKCFKNDYLAVVHSNIGGYKTDKVMNDDISYSVEIQEDGGIIGHLTVKRTHEGGNDKYWWYNRKNIDYLKVYVPSGSKILSYSGGERREVANPVDYEKLGFDSDEDILAIENSLEKFGSIDVFLESGKTVFGTWLVTSPQKTTIFDIYYKLPFKVGFNNGIGKYNLYIQKQPGTSVRMEASVTAPDNWKVVWDTETNDLEKLPALNEAETFILDTDKVIGYIFKK